MKLKQLYSSFGYTKYRMSKFEEFELYIENKSFLENSKIITFNDFNGRLMALRPDVTLSIVKNAKPELLQKVYYSENVYRSVKGSSSVKEILQTGLEVIGCLDAYTISEVLDLAVRSLMLLSEDCVLDLSHMGFISAILDKAELDEKHRRSIIAYLGEKNMHDIVTLCDSLGVDRSVTEKITDLVKVSGKISEALPIIKERFADESTAEYISELEELYSALSIRGSEGRINIDFSVVNDLSYYSGIVFQGFINEAPQRVLSGGRYDKLLSKMGKGAGALGFAVYVGKLEQYSSTQNTYDADVLLLYDKEVKAASVAAVVNKLTANGESIFVARSDAQCEIKCRNRYLITKEGVSLDA